MSFDDYDYDGFSDDGLENVFYAPALDSQLGIEQHTEVPVQVEHHMVKRLNRIVRKSKNGNPNDGKSPSSSLQVKAPVIRVLQTLRTIVDAVPFADITVFLQQNSDLLEHNPVDRVVELRMHKCVLASNSNYFRALMKWNEAAVDTNSTNLCIDCAGIGGIEIVMRMLVFIYKWTLPRIAESAEKAELAEASVGSLNMHQWLHAAGRIILMIRQSSTR